MKGQITLDSIIHIDGEDLEDLRKQVTLMQEYARTKRNWENAFQRWSDAQHDDGTTSTGACGYGSMCDYCRDNSYGRPCVRALNEMCREKGLRIDYSNRDFEKVWYTGGSDDDVIHESH